MKKNLLHPQLQQQRTVVPGGDGPTTIIQNCYCGDENSKRRQQQQQQQRKLRKQRPPASLLEHEKQQARQATRGFRRPRYASSDTIDPAAQNDFKKYTALLPIFILDAITALQSADELEGFPNLEDRYNHLAGTLFNGLYANNRTARYAVLSLYPRLLSRSAIRT